jgi:hypothetical protein
MVAFGDSGGRWLSDIDWFQKEKITEDVTKKN